MSAGYGKAVRAVLISAGCAIVIAGEFIAGCTPSIPPVVAEDAGDESYMRQAVPILHGRKIRGYDEVKLLRDLAQITSRDLVVRALAQQPDYRTHWSEVLVDDLRVHREGARAQTACYGAPLRAGADSGALADWLRTHAPASSNPPTFNMSDVLRSSLKADNLYPIYSGHLFALENKPGFDTPQAMRNTLGATFGKVYLNREMLCLGCHNSEHSFSGESTGWNRTHPIPGNFESALYGASEGEPTADAFAVFRTDVLGGPLNPWGMSSSCGTFYQTVPNDPLGITAHFTASLGQQATIRKVQELFASGYNNLDADGLQRTLDPALQADCTFCSNNCTGSSLDEASIANSAPNAATVKTLLTNTVYSGSGKTCIGCHGGTLNIDLTTGTDWANDLIGESSSQGMKLVTPGDASNSYLIKKLEGTGAGGRMPQGGPFLSAAQINQIKAWINGMPVLTACATCSTLNCSQPRRYVAGDEAFTFLTAAHVVDNVWNEAMGHPLTIANYFPRNPSQRDALWILTEYRFVPNDWSLQDLLARTLTTDYFNRKAPQFTALGSAYVVPPLLDPWALADPRVPPVSASGYSPAAHPENHNNAMGEGVYRYSARSLLNSTHEALGWPTPQRFPPASGYPDVNLSKAIGQFFTDAEPGFRGVDFQGLLFWESVHGACSKPTGVAQDWINRVMDKVAAFDPASPGGPLTVEDLVVVLRDWLLGHGGIGSGVPVDLSVSEAQALATYFGVAALSVQASAVPSLEQKLRGVCGVMVETPQFMLAGIAPAGLGPKPRLRACNGGPCTYAEMCQALAPAVNAQLGSGQSLLCSSDSVNILERIKPPRVWDEICPHGLCGPWLKKIPEGCWPGPQLFSRVASMPLACPGIEPPACDPRCSRIDCCGGPLPPVDRRDRTVALAWAEGAEVRVAQGVKIRPGGAEKFEDLNAGRRLQIGDLLSLPAGSRFSATTKGGEFKTPNEGLPKDEAPRGALLMLVTGEKAIQQQSRGASEMRKPPVEIINRVRNSAWARRGEAGKPLELKEYQSYQYSKQEIGLDRLIKRGLWPPRKQEQSSPAQGNAATSPGR
jgi:hypothetical protein